MSPRDSSQGLNGLQTRQEKEPPPSQQQQMVQQTAQQTAQETAQQSMTSMPDLKRHDAHLKMIAEQLETVIDWVHRRQV